MPQVEKSRNDKVEVTRRDQVKVTHPITTAVYTQLLMTLCITENGDLRSTHVAKQLLQRCHFLPVVICAEFDLLDRQVTLDDRKPQFLGFCLLLDAQKVVQSGSGIPSDDIGDAALGGQAVGFRWTVGKEPWSNA